ncbi:hypothetical protein LJC59_02190 [Desulfovibrio sp. OttesenSCG-928-A18]|nr:hypothetical protein [Desulfovibrio sp. OttesenSCG-928-A18]
MNPLPVILRHGCKINYTLRVLRRRPDGYHDLESLFLPLSLPCDRLEIRPLPDQDGQKVESARNAEGRPSRQARYGRPGRAPAQGLCRVEFVRAEEAGGVREADGAREGEALGAVHPLEGVDPADNTLTRAYAWYAARTAFAPGLAIRVHKGIPMGAGLGGGSANAACLLAFLQQEAARSGLTPLSREALLSGAWQIGADVPFFILGRAAMARGTGEILTPVPNPVAGLYLLLLCPGIGVPTGWAYAALDAARGDAALCKKSGRPEPPEKNTKAEGSLRDLCLTGRQSQATNSLAQAMEPANDFEGPVFARFPELGRLKSSLYALGAAQAGMSGTGSALFGLFRDEDMALAAMKTLASKGFAVYMQQMA